MDKTHNLPVLHAVNIVVWGEELETDETRRTQLALEKASDSSGHDLSPSTSHLPKVNKKTIQRKRKVD